SPPPRRQSSSIQRDQRSVLEDNRHSRNRSDKISCSRESLSCGGNACKRCGKCCDWTWDNSSHDWNRDSDATCRGLYTVDGNNHYVRGPGGGRGGGGIFPICECSRQPVLK
ncbi:unnamed protein product, partial [Rotaria socialis]